ncbi:hypothetical protein [Aureimonas sp. ME7]|uniref:hypothetical protein n=1 Tax=Aureimonas sp. ME7 TaxID=2744252 RepID=UPI0015F42165|nr:hypothetical protein [Aureimonas sp. ME7]
MRTPNYNFERQERDRAKAAKKAEKAAAKAAAKADGNEPRDDAAAHETPPASPSPS